ncbi:Uncharacterised protein [Segatella copri]|nr:Uncharacterised protein [Segatella copri]
MLMAGAVAFIRDITSVLNKVSSKKLLNQSESLFLRANNIIKTSKFYFTRPLGSLRFRRDFCLLIFLLFFCFRLETPLFFRTPLSFSFSFHSLFLQLMCQRTESGNVGTKG